MSRDDHLGEKIILELERNGKIGVDALAELLKENPKPIATACACLHRLGRVRRIDTGFSMRNKKGRKKKLILWEIGPAENIPPMPDRTGNKKNHDEQHKGIDGADLEWMERYRQQHQKRMAMYESR